MTPHEEEKQAELETLAWELYGLLVIDEDHHGMDAEVVAEEAFDASKAFLAVRERVRHDARQNGRAW